jgi:nucleotide-binding universal stress UspA family protein
MTAQDRSDGRARIVVGVDGSEFARTALEYALDEAVRRDATVEVVWAFPMAEYWAGSYGLPNTVLEETTAELEESARKLLDAVRQERGGAVADVPAEVRAVAGPAAPVLVERAKDADLLVVGHRGRGGFASAVLGSVGLQCVLHAQCPVTVVRPTGRASGDLVGAG